LKLIYIVIDGMGDLPIAELGNRTALEAAETPFMDSLARNGKTGLMYTVGKGMAPESDVAVVSILGYDPFMYPMSRGVLEAVGSQMDMENGDLALRCNFGTIADDEISIVDRRAGRDLTQQEADELAEALNKQVKLESHPASFEIKSTAVHRATLIIKRKDGNLSGNIDNTDPAYKRVNGAGVADLDAKLVLKSSVPFDETEEAKVAADLVNEFTRKAIVVLNNHEVNKKRVAQGKFKANVILGRNAGSIIPEFVSLCDRYDMGFVCLADMNVERGIAALAGMSVVDIPLPSKDLAWDCQFRLKKLFEVLPDYDAFYIHIKGPDEPGHDGDCKLKAELISIIDEHFVGELLKKIDLDDCVVCVTADHSTPCELKSHSDDPVPVLIAGNNVKADKVQRFSETECKNGELGVLTKGTQLLPKLVEFLKR